MKYRARHVNNICDRTLADFDRALELAPQERGLYGNRSMVFAGLGRLREAAGDIEKALFLNTPIEERNRSKLVWTAFSN
jgi:hypothetical protein